MPSTTRRPPCRPSYEPAPLHAAIAALRAIDPDTLSPREALEQLYALKRLQG